MNMFFVAPTAVQGGQRFVVVMRLCICIALNSLPVMALSPAVAAPATQFAVPERTNDEQRVIRYTFKELGALYPLNLRGTDSRDGVDFNIRADEVVTKATLKLDYAYSPSLISDLSHMIVLLNDQAASTIELPKEHSGKALVREIDITTRLISDFNRLSLQLIAHYTMQCEDPLHTSLWAKISQASTLEITTRTIASLNDLSILPLPFMDRRTMGRLNLPIIFESAPDQVGLEAGGIVASWFGALAADRGVRFTALLGGPPAKGHGVLLTLNTSATIGLAPLRSDKPEISMVVNPNDPNGKLLVLRARSSAGLRLAALALTMGNQVLTGQTALIERVDISKLRRPYDAPNWLPSDRSVKFEELISQKKLNVSGYGPEVIRVNMQLPPDLFDLNEKGVPVHLKYRYTPQATSKNSSLLLSINNLFVKSYVLLPITRLGDNLMQTILDNQMLPLQTRLNIPLSMFESHSELQFKYMYDYVKQGECQDMIVDNVRGAIDPESTIDISSLSHFLEMPNLKVFSETGFPFTRMADLSETAVVMAEAPTIEEYAAFFDVMGRMGASTGYPATAVSVITASKIDGAADKDLILITLGRNNPLLARWSTVLPVRLTESSRFNISDMASRAWNFFSFPRQEKLQDKHAEMIFNATGQLGVFAGFESPLARKRSVVVIWGTDHTSLTDNISALFAAPKSERKIAGSLTVVRQGQVSTLLSEKTYSVGHLGWYQQIYSAIAKHLLAFALLSGLVCLILVSMLISAILNFRSRARP